VAAASSRVAAHIGLHEEINQLTALLEEEATNAELFLKRAELYRMHRKWPNALADYQRARQLDSTLAAVELGLGRLYLDQGLPDMSIPFLDDLIDREPDNIQGLLSRAKAWSALGEHLISAQDYTQVIDRLQGGDTPVPEYYYERARELSAAGNKHIDSALQGLDEGMALLGPVAPLELFAIELEIKARRYDAALDRLESAIARSARKETWLVQRGDVLLLACRHQEARESYMQALSSIDRLPGSRRNTPAIHALQSSTERKLAADVAPGCVALPERQYK
jgi:predicted Zn-dependent protease